MEEKADKIKYPRTWHLPFSKKPSDDDRVLSSTGHFNDKEVIVTEKLDGESFTIYPTGEMHARSVNYNPHISHDKAKEQLACVKWGIPDNWRIVGENVRAVHTMNYDAVDNYPYYVYAIFNEHNRCLGWDDMVEFCESINLNTVPLLWRGIYNEKKVKQCYTGKSTLGGEQEGYVVRIADEYHYDDFTKNVAKYVRPDFGHLLNTRHEGRHWRSGKIDFHPTKKDKDHE